jgi:uncharacterized protein (TIGR04255 family)
VLFNFPDLNGRFRLRDAPLARAIAVVRYPLVAAFADIAGLREAQEVLSEAFPDLRESPATQFEVTFGPNQIAQQQSSFKQWVFTGNDDEYEILITPGLMQISVPGANYEDRQQFSEIFELALTALSRSRVASISGFTMRYVNAVLAEGDWEQHWNPQLLGWIASPHIAAPQRSSMSQASLGGGIVTLENGTTVPTNAIVRHGLVGGLAPDLMRDALSKPSFIVDCEMSSANPLPLNAETLLAVFREYNHEMAHFLAFALTPVGRAHYGWEER